MDSYRPAMLCCMGLFHWPIAMYFAVITPTPTNVGLSCLPLTLPTSVPGRMVHLCAAREQAMCCACCDTAGGETKVVHRIAVFESHGEITNVISQMDVMRWVAQWFEYYVTRWVARWLQHYITSASCVVVACQEARCAMEGHSMVRACQTVGRVYCGLPACPCLRTPFYGVGAQR